MISSIDPGKLEAILAFASLLDVMKNQDKYQAFVDEAKDTLAELSEVLKDKGVVDGVDKYAQERFDAIKKQQDDLEVAKNQLDILTEQRDVSFKAKILELEVAQAEAKNLKDQSLQSIREAKEKQDELDKREKQIIDRFQAIAEKEQLLTAKEADLRSKSDQLKLLLG